jgi:hypothetical protein
MEPMEEWFLRHEKYLTGITLVRRHWSQTRENWDHDHCEFCWKTFSDWSGALHEGWTDPEEYWWICDDCFSKFHERFRWVTCGD